MSAAGEMPERKRQAGRQEAVRQLLQALGPAALVQVEGAGLQAGAEAAADLCEGTFAIQKRCHNLTRVLRRGLEAAEDHCLLSATRFEPQKNDLGHHLTPEGVFFLPMIYFPLLNGDFVNGPSWPELRFNLPDRYTERILPPSSAQSREPAAACSPYGERRKARNRNNPADGGRR